MIGTEGFPAVSSLCCFEVSYFNLFYEPVRTCTSPVISL